VPSDGDFGAHALRDCLRGEGIEVSTIEILPKENKYTKYKIGILYD